jgi:hypothetical protein
MNDIDPETGKPKKGSDIDNNEFPDSEEFDNEFEELSR